MSPTAQRLLPVWTTLGLTWLLVSAAAGEPTNVRLNDPTSDPPTSTQSAPVLRTFDRFAMAAWFDITPPSFLARVRVAASSDSGATFPYLGALSNFTIGTTSWRWRGDPQLAVDRLATSNQFVLAGQVQAIGTAQSGVAIARGGLIQGSFLFFNQPVLVHTDPGGAGAMLPSVGLDVDDSGVYHIVSSAPRGNGRLFYYRSTDGGATWSPRVQISDLPDDTTTSYPRIERGVGQELHAAWTATADAGGHPLRYRKSLDRGLTWLPEQTVSTIRDNALHPGFGYVSGRPEFSMAVNRVPGTSTYGRVAFAWSECWDNSDELFPPLGGAPVRNETEPNDTAATAASFDVGDVLQGSFATSTDRDWWKVTLTAGQSLLLWPDTRTLATDYAMSIIAPDGVASITTSSGPGLSGLRELPSHVIAWTAPSSGTYFLRLAHGLAGFSYRIRTRAGTPGGSEARDARDVAVVHSTGAGWSSPVRVTTTSAGHDDFLPAITWGEDGLDYVSWYDFSRIPGAPSQSHLVLARNLAGDVPDVGLPQIVTSAPTDWDRLLWFWPPGMSYRNDVHAGPGRLFVAWADGRSGDPDVYTAVVSTAAVPAPSVGDTVAAVGGQTALQVGVTNANTMFPEQIQVQVSGARSWPGALAVDGSIAPASYGVIAVPIAVPDTAAAGVYALTVQTLRRSGAVLATRTVNLSIPATTSVGGRPGAIAFGLDPITPNPARGPARVTFRLPESGMVRLEVFGIRGERMRTLAEASFAAGSHSLTWDGRGTDGRVVPPGVYLVRIQAGGRETSRRVLMVE